MAVCGVAVTALGPGPVAHARCTEMASPVGAAGVCVVPCGGTRGVDERPPQQDDSAGDRRRRRRRLQPAALTLRGKPYRLRQANGAFYITESQPHRTSAGTPRAVHARQPPHPALPHHHRPRPHRRAAPDLGRAAAASGSTTSRSSGPTRAIGNPVQQWNKNCVGLPREPAGQPLSEPPPRTYATDMARLRHLVRAVSRARQRATPPRYRDGPGAACHRRPRHRPARLASLRPPPRPVCAQCHSLRDVVAPGFQAGASYDDHFVMKLEYTPRKEQDPVYWADGRPRRFSNDAVGLWQSQCYPEGRRHVHVVPRRPYAQRRPPRVARAREQRAVHAPATAPLART